jgi:hypothetical protein
MKTLCNTKNATKRRYSCHSMQEIVTYHLIVTYRALPKHHNYTAGSCHFMEHLTNGSRKRSYITVLEQMIVLEKRVTKAKIHYYMYMYIKFILTPVLNLFWPLLTSLFCTQFTVTCKPYVPYDNIQKQIHVSLATARKKDFYIICIFTCLMIRTCTHSLIH